MPAALDTGFLPKVMPGGFERRYRTRLAVGEHVPLGPELAEAKPVAFGVRRKGIKEHGVQRNRASFSGFGLAAA